MAAGQSSPAAQARADQESAVAQQQRSVAVQRQSIERQRAAAGTSAFSGFLPAADRQAVRWASPPGCLPVPPMLLQSAVQRAAGAHHVAPGLLHAVIRQESAGYPCAVSEKGAMGLMQLMPATAYQMGVSEPFDIDQNIDAGARLLADLMQRYNGDLNRVLGAYNAGTAAVDQAGGPPAIPETLSYIRSIVEQIKRPFGTKLFASPLR